MALTISTWNINSVRLRLPQLARFLAERRPDVVCLQETKVQDAEFPTEAIAALGYPYAHIHGMKSYNGVAIFARQPFDSTSVMGWCDRVDCRHAVAVIGGIEIHNLYVPAGGDIPDPEVNDKFAHKLRFLDETARWFATERPAGAGRPMVLVGDLNVAPLECDVWSHKQLLTVVSHTPIEVAHLGRLQAASGWIDAIRQVTPEPERLYSWWSYRNRDWKASDRGRRLDHIWVTPDLSARVQSADIARFVRDWEPPSDHVPVTVTLAQ